MKKCAFIIFLILLAHGLPLNAKAARVVRWNGSSTVWYVDDQGVRHAYPNQKVFESWYGGIPRIARDDRLVEVIGANELAGMRLGENVVMRPGSLVKVPSAPQVYAVEPGGILRPIVGEQTAIDVYGVDWAKRVVDVPEVFFFNYTIGAMVKSQADLPDGTVVRLEESNGKWHWKDKGVLLAFKDEQAVRANNLDPSSTVIIPQLFPIRSRVIEMRELRMTDPQWGIPLTSADCAAASLKTAVLYLSKGNSGATEKINQWRTTTASAWERRTDVLSLLAMNPVEEMVFDDRYLQSDGGIDVQEIARTYYDTHADDIDFLIIWNAVVPVSSTELAEFWPVTNVIEGLGKPLFERGDLYGSRGKLKGVINMGRPGDFPLDDSVGMARAVETGLHEFLHQWSGEADFRDATGADRAELQTEDSHHWSPLVDFISPLGGWGWQEQRDGTFVSKRGLFTTAQLRDHHFPDLDLYLLGLIPRHSVAPIRILAPVPAAQTLSATQKGTLKTVTIDDIVYGNGVRRCTVPDIQNPNFKNQNDA